MAQPSYGTALRHIHTLFNVGTIGALTDGQLLERFTFCDQEAAELAFAALVERHGPMVLRVCQSVVRERHDAEDAFQATFLVLEAHAMAALYNEIQEAVAALAKAKGLTYVVKVSAGPRADSDPNDVSTALNRSVVYADPRNDLTEEVIRDLNRRYKNEE